MHEQLLNSECTNAVIHSKVLHSVAKHNSMIKFYIVETCKNYAYNRKDINHAFFSPFKHFFFGRGVIDHKIQHLGGEFRRNFGPWGARN